MERMLFCRELLVVLLVLAVTCSGTEIQGVEERILGGYSVDDITTYPFMAQLQDSCGYLRCGASIVTPLWILTSASCMIDWPSHNRPAPLHKLRVVAGTVDSGILKQYCDGPAQVRFIAEVITRHKHVLLALIKLTSELEFGPRVNAVTFPPMGNSDTLPWEDKICKTLGWGFTHKPVQSSGLMAVDLKVISNRRCWKKFHGGATQEWIMCTQGSKKGACMGDSGGPLICDGVQAGISTYQSEDCYVEGFADAWTRLDLVRDWIEGITGESSSPARMHQSCVCATTFSRSSSGRNTMGVGGTILGGIPVKKNTTYPFMAQLQDSCGKLKCAATIITPLWILTSAACVIEWPSATGRPIPLHKLRVVAGTLFTHNPEKQPFCGGSAQVRNIRKIIIRYERVLVALLMLTSELEFGPTVNAVTFPRMGDPETLPWEDKMCKALAWGTSNSSVQGPVLMEVKLKIISHHLCWKVLQNNHMYSLSIMCTHTYYKGMCAGETGGPLICDGVQAGLSSIQSRDCSHYWFADAWTRLDLIRDWIDEVIRPSPQRLFCPCATTVVGNRNHRGWGLEDDDPGRLTGGEAADIKDFPYMASLQDSCTGKHRCGGTILNSLWVLTSAFCIFSDVDDHRLEMFPVHKFRVMIGSTNITGLTVDEECGSSNVIRYIAKMIPDEKFRKPNFNSIALLKLTTEIDFDDGLARPVKIPLQKHDVHELLGGKQCTTLGWGMTERGEPEKEVSPTLLKAVVPITNKDCREQYNEWPYPGKDMICSYNENNISACLNDEGGPLICNGTQLGIMLWPACIFNNARKINGFACVDFYLEWITERMRTSKGVEVESDPDSTTAAPDVTTTVASDGPCFTATPHLSATLIVVVALITP